MNKLSGSELFFICDKCKHPNRILRQGEFLLPYLAYVVCGACSHKHADVKKLADYSKTTRGCE